MSKAPYFMTGDALFSDHLRVVVTIPKSQQNWVYSVFLGALDFMTKSESWITAGESDQNDAAAIYKAILEGIEPMPFYAGSIMWSAAATLPAGAPYLACDGSVYHGADYATLYAAIGTTYNAGGEAPGDFRVPDLRGRDLVGVDPTGIRITAAWANALAGAGGEELHSLIGAEVPTHSHADSGHFHGYQSAFPNLTSIAPGVPEADAVPISASTTAGFANLDSFGGNGPHNNVQPTMVMWPYIYTEG